MMPAIDSEVAMIKADIIALRASTTSVPGIDAKLLQIGGGTDEIQQITCAKALMRGDMVLG